MTAVRVCPRCQRRFDDPELRCCPDDSADLLEELARYSSRAERVVGKVVAGRFLVERVLGEGGMGLVLAARHLTLPQRVAIKLLHPELTAVADIRDRRPCKWSIRPPRLCRHAIVGTAHLCVEACCGCDSGSNCRKQAGRWRDHGRPA